MFLVLIFLVAMLMPGPQGPYEVQAIDVKDSTHWLTQNEIDNAPPCPDICMSAFGSLTTDEVITGKCPSCPSAKSIAEQVIENLDARPRPTITHCRRPRPARAGGYTAKCTVFFPAPGTPIQ